MKLERKTRVRILYLLSVVLILVSVVPLLFYGTRMIRTNQETLETYQQVLQTTTAQSLGHEISLYMANLRQNFNQLFDAVLSLVGQIAPSKFSTDADLRALLENFVTDPHNVTFVYVTVVNDVAQGRGAQAPSYNVIEDAFVRKSLESAFMAARQSQDYQSEPPITLVTPKGRELVMVIGRPLKVKDQFLGMVGAVVTFKQILQRLKDAPQYPAPLEAYIVDGSGRLVASNNLEQRVPGMDMVNVPIVQKLLSHGASVETSEFPLVEGNKVSQMLGTYSQIRNVNWGVVVQTKKSEAYHFANEMRWETARYGLGLILVSLVVGVIVAKSITRPIDQLTQTARAIAQRDFSQRANIESRTEIGELAQTFNLMAEDIQHYISDLQKASEENRQLFMDSIEMIAAAVDAKDPYTKGHSGRVSQYSVILAKELGLPEDEVDKVRISATLHDVGKIGIDDRVLKKPGVLTSEEFELMKRHTVMGYEIVRQVKQLTEMLPGIRWHHESLSGQGYPDGLKGDELPLMTRIIAVADTFDAISTDRPYQAGSDFPKALEILRKHAGTRYDPIVVDAMLAAYAKGALQRFETRRATLASIPSS